jgi:hypothetical protein
MLDWGWVVPNLGEWALPFVKECMLIFLKGFFGFSICVITFSILIYIGFLISNWFESIYR